MMCVANLVDHSPLVGGLVLPQGVPAQVQAATGDQGHHDDHQDDDDHEDYTLQIDDDFGDYL